MPLSHLKKEARIEKAIGAWQSTLGRPITEIAREFDISLWALYKRLYGVPSKREVGELNKKLTTDGEQAII